jgi:hypothetical protein
VSDLLACRALAREGHAKMAIAGSYGEPIFNRFFGVALAYFVITVPVFPEPYTEGIFIDLPLLVCFAFQTVALLVTVFGSLCDGFRIRSAPCPSRQTSRMTSCQHVTQYATDVVHRAGHGLAGFCSSSTPCARLHAALSLGKAWHLPFAERG